MTRWLDAITTLRPIATLNSKIEVELDGNDSLCFIRFFFKYLKY